MGKRKNTLPQARTLVVFPALHKSVFFCRGRLFAFLPHVLVTCVSDICFRGIFDGTGFEQLFAL